MREIKYVRFRPTLGEKRHIKYLVYKHDGFEEEIKTFKWNDYIKTTSI